MPAKRLRMLREGTRSFLTRHLGRMDRRGFSRPFSDGIDSRILILSLGDRIPQSQVHPFHTYAAEVFGAYGAEIREVPLDDQRKRSRDLVAHATTICFQTNFDLSRDRLTGLVSSLRDCNPDARLVYLDWFAPTDLRYAEALDPYLSVYVKKHVLAEPLHYGLPTLGDTNLTDYYARRFGLDMRETVFPVPAGFRPKILVGPSFVTADSLERLFRAGVSPESRDRGIDLHARFAVAGTDWYQAMRAECAEAVKAMDKVVSVVEPNVGMAEYLRELRASKICFSPFGYGEVCWRDFEAVACGAVLLKPDMSHVRTDPDIFVPGETYMPVAWDLGDLPDQVNRLLGDEDLRRYLSENAFARLRDYVVSGRFVTQMAPIFS